MTDPQLQQAFAADVVFLRLAGLRPVVVHGGGPQINAMLDAARRCERVPRRPPGDHPRGDGRRPDGAHRPGPARRRGPGQRARPVRRRHVRRGRAPVHGRAARRPRRRRVPIDLGLVGDVVRRRARRSSTRLLDDGLVPVVSSVARGSDGEVYNVNADTAAAALAVALRRREARRAHRRRGAVRRLAGQRRDHQRADRGRARGTAADAVRGMVPKMEACLRAVRGGVPQAHVIDGRVPHALLLEVFTAEGVGTMVVPVTGVAERRDERGRWRAPLGRGRDEQLRHARRWCWRRAAAPGSGTSTGAPTSTWSAGSRSTSLGHAHPAVVEAVSRQVATLGHTSNLVVNRARARSWPSGCSPCSAGTARVFFCNSGAEANEAALKLARRAPGGRTVVVAPRARSTAARLGALSITGQPAKREPVRAAAARDRRSSRTATSTRCATAVGAATAAVVLEPVQGEGGVVVPPAGLPRRGRARRATGTGRCSCSTRCRPASAVPGTGSRTSSEGVRADVVTLAKGLGGGLPHRGVHRARTARPALLGPGQHGSTFGGNPVSCAAALAVLDTIERDGLLARAADLGARDPGRRARRSTIRW